jgi:hypothetical protein
MQPVGNKLDRFFIPLNDRFINQSENNPEPLVGPWAKNTVKLLRNMEPLATYSNNSVECKGEFLLFSDELVIHVSPRGFFRPRLDTERRFPLSAIDPAALRGTCRRWNYAGLGIILGIFSLGVCRGLRDTLWSLPIIVAGFVLSLVAIRAGFRLVEVAQFQNRDGSWAFSVFIHDHDREKFESFVHAITHQIQVSKKAT